MVWFDAQVASIGSQSGDPRGAFANTGRRLIPRPFRQYSKDIAYKHKGLVLVGEAALRQQDWGWATFATSFGRFQDPWVELGMRDCGVLDGSSALSSGPESSGLVVHICRPDYTPDLFFAGSGAGAHLTPGSRPAVGSRIRPFELFGWGQRFGTLGESVRLPTQLSRKVASGSCAGGVAGSLPLPVLPARCGRWSACLGLCLCCFLE